MKAATITNAERDAAEHRPITTAAAKTNVTRGSTQRATITGGRGNAALTGRVRGTGVPDVARKQRR